jgi:uncharacterized membrane protein YtjA (UPF0391 family)
MVETRGGFCVRCRTDAKPRARDTGARNGSVFADWRSTQLRFANSLTLLKGNKMLHYTVVFLVIALVAALFGFTGIAAGAVGIAKILFYIFLLLFVISLVFGLMRQK